MNQPSITIDAGHGGKDPGAVGPNGLREKDVALAVALRLGAMLAAAGFLVDYTRKTDRFLELSERASLANLAGTKLFLSIHCNSAKVPAAGFEVFTTPGQSDSDEFATCLFLEYGKRFPWMAKRVDDRDGDLDKEANFTVLMRTKSPAALFELGFIHTAEGEAWLADPLNQIAMAEALCDGVLRYAAVPAPAKPLPAPKPVKRTLKERLRSLSTELANLAEELPDR